MDMDERIETNPNERTDTGKPKRNCLILIMIASAVWGGLIGLLPEESPYANVTDLFFAFLLNIIILVWCYLDSEERKFTISRRLGILIFLIWIVGLSYYLSKTRNRRDALIALGLAALLFATAYGVNLLSYQIGCCIYDRLYYTA